MSSPAITTDTHVYFYSGGTIYSNWHTTSCQFTDPLTGFVYHSTEMAFMHMKALFFRDDRVAETILRDDGEPARVKLLGRQIRGYDDASWECVRLGFMTYVNLLKFRQNPAWRDELKATDNRILVEASPVDRIWGIGRSVEEAAAGARWDGRNLLGEALMTVRGLL